MKDEKGFLTMLGFAAKARKVVGGETPVESFLKQANKVQLLIIATDLAEDRKLQWQKKAETLEIECVEGLDKVTMGTAVGMSPRGVLAILDEQMAKAICMRV